MRGVCWGRGFPGRLRPGARAISIVPCHQQQQHNQRNTHHPGDDQFVGLFAPRLFTDPSGQLLAFVTFGVELTA